ncbi:glycosyltransferase family 9 protein [Candidatus Binatus sp.]|jgi:heptosyltransferase-3|uniref:glycosyltransferase family 9 protein n=3 Tax=Candidatus Binatus sp. TaxID=2811406 RepID=UPI003C56FD61
MTPHENAARSIGRVLVIFPGALGDLMCLMPALAAISRRHRGASVELMARLELARLAAGRTVVARGHSIDAREVGELFTEAGAESDETPVNLNARRFFGDFDRIYSFFASGDRRFRARLAAATDAEVSFHPFRPAGDGHVSAAYLRAIEIDETASPANPRLEPTVDDLAAAAGAIAQSKCGSSNLIVIFPGSGSPGKNWPADKFAALASKLSLSNRARFADPHLHPIPYRARKFNAQSREEDPGSLGFARDDTKSKKRADKEYERRISNRASVAVILGPAEMSMEPIFRRSGVPLLKHLDLPTVAAIARVASAFVGVDSGVSHLAAAAGASGVVIFGPTDPARWRPLAPGARGQIEVLRRDPIDSIEPDEVAALIVKICGVASKIIH